MLRRREWGCYEAWHKEEMVQQPAEDDSVQNLHATQAGASQKGDAGRAGGAASGPVAVSRFWYSTTHETAAAKLVTKASQWRKIETRGSRPKDWENFRTAKFGPADKVVPGSEELSGVVSPLRRSGAHRHQAHLHYAHPHDRWTLLLVLIAIPSLILILMLDSDRSYVFDSKPSLNLSRFRFWSLECPGAEYNGASINYVRCLEDRAESPILTWGVRAGGLVNYHLIFFTNY
ncbi:hypothetical protein EVAR_12019_1 [Eumeta japonica]|uniref:Uncharacterized protein n=1 Tax=Eumeta variegata TaxID=151549 RepID=A0A4C1U576_EUMVA|nr:hypothetical protein EVAR_12019_1 [Eumeta japonica]